MKQAWCEKSMTHDFDHVTRTRRGKPVRCHWCHEQIETGDKYVTWGQVHDGYLNRMNMHPECETAYNSSQGLDEFSPGDFERGVSYA